MSDQYTLAVMTTATAEGRLKELMRCLLDGGTAVLNDDGRLELSVATRNDLLVTRHHDGRITVDGCDPDEVYPVLGSLLLEIVEAHNDHLALWQRDNSP